MGSIRLDCSLVFFDVPFVDDFFVFDGKRIAMMQRCSGTFDCMFFVVVNHTLYHRCLYLMVPKPVGIVWSGLM